MVTTSDRQRGGAATGLACAIVGVLVTACFRDGGSDQQCDGAVCATGGPTTGAAATSGGSSTGEVNPTTSGAVTTGAPVDRGVTLRVDTMRFIDPHLFLSESGGDETGTTGADMAKCVNDVTELINGVLTEDIDSGKFNLLAHFEDFAGKPEMRLIDADCEDPAVAGGTRVCTRNVDTPVVVLDVELVLTPDCRQLDPLVYAAVNLPLINDPQPPCLRTRATQFSLPVSDAVGSLDLRAAQMVSTLDSADSPTRLMNGVLYGFLPMVAAQNLELEAPLFGLVDLWTVLEAAPCAATYPDLLPSVDTFEIDDKAVPGVWLAINFTAEQVEYVQ